MDPKKRMYIILGSVGVAALAIILYLIFFTNDKEEPAVINGIPLSQEDKDKITKTVKDFYEDAGTWGLDYDKLTPENTMLVRNSVSTSTRDNMFWVDRRSVYNSVKQDYLTDGPLIYANKDVSTWVDEIARDRGINFSVKAVNSDVKPEAESMIYNGATTMLASVKVLATHEEKSLDQPRDDASWDGTFEIDSQNITNNATVQLIKDSSGEWKIYNMTDVSHPFLTVLWKNANEDYDEVQAKVKKIGEIKTKKD